MRLEVLQCDRIRKTSPWGRGPLERSVAASERIVDNLKTFEDLQLKSKASSGVD